MRTVAIVGAGTAGCVVARRISDAFRGDARPVRIVLIEQGTYNEHHDDADFMSSLSDESSVVTRMNATVTQQIKRDPYSYLQGRCVGGGGAVNGMVVSPLHSEDFDIWRDEYGCSEWDPANVTSGADDLFPVATISIDDVGVVGRALIAAGAQTAPLLWNGRRISGAVVIADAVSNGAIEIINSRVVRLVIDDGVVSGVATDVGVVNAEVVVMASGAVSTPLLLRQSNISERNIGQHAQDHPSVFFTIQRPSAFTGGANATALLSMGDTQLIGYESAHPTTPMFGGVSLSVLNVKSRGQVTGTTEAPRIDLNLLGDPRDQELMRRAVRTFVGETVPTLEEHCGSVLCDARGTSARELLSLADSALDAWAYANVVPHSHISGTCAMGNGPHSVVSQRGQFPSVRGLYVADASVFPQLPRSNTNMVVAVVASQIASFIVEDLL